MCWNGLADRLVHPLDFAEGREKGRREGRGMGARAFLRVGVRKRANGECADWSEWGHHVVTRAPMRAARSRE